MKKQLYRLSFLFALAVSVVLFLSFSVEGQSPPTPTPSPTPLSALRIDPDQLKASLDQGNVADAIQQLERGWRQQLNDYYHRYIRTDIPSTNQISQSLRQIAADTGQRSALIYAISVPNQLEVMLLLPNGQLQHRRITAATPEAVADVTRVLRMGLVNVRTPAREYLPAAQQLYEWIVEPLKPALQAQQIDHLIFCLGGKFRGVPMAALYDGQQFLIEQYGVSIIPAFNLLDRRLPQLSEARVLAMGSSEFQELEPLPAVPIELEAIARLWQGEVWLNQQFTLDTLKQRRSQYPFDMIHLATHATFEAGAVHNSYIQFWDRRLWLDQLRDMNLQFPTVELLVLSACRTAVGDPNAELGFAGLAVQSGAKAALASLWSVSDAATTVLMTGFYQALKTASTKAEALRQVQLDMLKGRISLESPSIQQALRDIPIPSNVMNSVSNDLSHPYYWSGFTMIGNPW